MTTEIQKFEVTDETLNKFLDVFGASKLTVQEKTQFLQISKAFGLNPFKREIHMIKYGDEFSIVVGYEVYIKRAEASGLLQGWKCWTDGELKPIKKTITKKGKNGNYQKEITVFEGNFKACIEIIRKDWTKPFYHEVYLSEYAKENEFWGKPITMLKKVVMGQGFRLCFTEFCGGMPYTEEETQSFVEAEIVEEIELTDLQKQALELTSTAIFENPKSYSITENEIKKDSVPERIQKIIDYLNTKQKKNEPKTVDPIPESKEKKPELLPALLQKTLEALSKGEFTVFQATLDTYSVTDEQKKTMKEAIQAKMEADNDPDISETKGKDVEQMNMFDQNELLKSNQNDKI